MFIDRFARAGLACAGLVCSIALLPTAHAQNFPPDKPVRLVVPGAPGGSADAITRALGTEMSKDMGVPFVVENRIGAGGAVATEAMLKLPADGHFIMLQNSSHVTNPIFLKDLPYDTLRDTAAMGYLGYIPLVFVTPVASTFTSVREVIAQAKAKPGAIQYASGGIGSGAHLAGELFKFKTGTDMVHIPFQGNAPAITAVLGGHVPLMFDTLPNSLANIRAGKLRVLALSSARRSPILADVPTVAESGVADFDVSAWIIYIVRAGTPREVMQTLNTSFNKVLNSPEFRNRPALSGVELVGGSVDQANAFVRSEMELWGRVAKATGMKS